MAAVELPGLLAGKAGRAEGRIAVLRKEDNDGNSDDGTERRLDVLSAPGRVGFILVNPKESIPPYVHYVPKDSPLLGRILKGDWVVSVEGEDVSGKTTREVSRLDRSWLGATDAHCLARPSHSWPPCV